MSDRGDNNFMRYIYRGEEGEIIPREATHITVHKDVTVIHEQAFFHHPNIVEIICHENVKKIVEEAFYECPKLKRVFMPGVEVVERGAFMECEALEDVECGKLEIIGYWAFGNCRSLQSINLPSARIVGESAFGNTALAYVKFGSKLEQLKERVFWACESLERITLPLKDGMFAYDDAFVECEKLHQVDLAEGELHETIAAFQLEEWRSEMYEEINSINQILPNADAGYYDEDDILNVYEGEKDQAIRRWIRSVLHKIVHYKAEHRRILSEAATLLELAIWKANLDDTDGDRIVSEGVRTTRGSVKRARRELCVTSGASIVIKNVLPFLELKS